MTLHQQPVSDEEFATRMSQPLLSEKLVADTLGTNSVAPGDVKSRNLQVALRSYRSETLQWAQGRSAGQPSLAALAHKQERWAALPRWSLALVAMVTIAGGVAHLASMRAATEQPAVQLDASAAVNRSSNPSDIAADNQLLSSIDAELSYHAASPVDSLQLQQEPAVAVEGAVSGVTD